ncbi:MAG: hypothetical protein K0Q72_129 [Armatimonadetes bacterium]|jgi:hypothetical protein|nr:hypothetical protein [Armatimonadota bacterium]
MKRSLFLVPLLLAQAGLALAAAPERLTDQNYAEVRKHVELRPGDLRFQQVDWNERVLDGVVQAQKEDKPLVLWLYFGDPRGNC